MLNNVPGDKLIKDLDRPDKQAELKELLIKNLELNTKILDKVGYIKKYIVWQKVFGWLKLFLIFIPLVLGFIYLPPLIEKLTKSYETLSAEFRKVQNLDEQLPDLSDVDIKKLLPQ